MAHRRFAAAFGFAALEVFDAFAFVLAGALEAFAAGLEDFAADLPEDLDFEERDAALPDVRDAGFAAGFAADFLFPPFEVELFFVAICFLLFNRRWGAVSLKRVEAVATPLHVVL